MLYRWEARHEDYIMVRIQHCGSEHYDERCSGSSISYVVLHYTDTLSLSETLSIFSSPDSRVSSHYLVDRDGGIYSFVGESFRAWHAGLSFWGGLRDINSYSLGIELQNPGHSHGYIDFTAAQLSSLVGLLGDICSRYAIGSGCFLGHSDIAPSRKIDPGERFPWSWLAAEGFGIFPDGGVIGDASDLVSYLHRLGYGDASDEACIAAFQRRYRVSRIDGVADDECAGLALSLLQKLDIKQ